MVCLHSTMNLRKVRICAQTHSHSHTHLHIKWAYHRKVIYSHTCVCVFSLFYFLYFEDEERWLEWMGNVVKIESTFFRDMQKIFQEPFSNKDPENVNANAHLDVCSRFRQNSTSIRFFSIFLILFHSCNTLFFCYGFSIIHIKGWNVFVCVCVQFM